ncbi:hypothetical protein HWV62_21550 [Athelia sp. TMB]|nr:hypothetical protein HWV62_21550 [Athelia sp. TMB]
MARRGYFEDQYKVSFNCLILISCIPLEFERFANFTHSNLHCVGYLRSIKLREQSLSTDRKDSTIQMIDRALTPNPSTECQKAHWKHHKPTCTLAAQERKELEEKLRRAGKYPHAYADFIKWCDYYATPMKNATIAALNLPAEPHSEKDGLLNIVISYKDDWAKYPSHKRFDVQLVSYPRRCDTDPTDYPTPFQRECMAVLDSPGLAALRTRGKIEFGHEFYGVTQYIVAGIFALPGLQVPLGMTRYHKAFSFSKDYARATVNPHWVMLFRDFVLKGNRMRFCCGKLDVPGSDEPVCCCGGWTHNSKDMVRLGRFCF